MKKDVFRLLIGCSLSLVVCLAFGQRGGTGHSSSGGGGSVSSGRSGGFSGGGFGSGRSGSYSSGRSYSGYSSRTFGSGSSFGSTRGYSGYSSRTYSGSAGRSYSQGASPSRYSSANRMGSSAYAGHVGTSGMGAGSRYLSSSRGISRGDSSFEQSHSSLSRSGSNRSTGNNNINSGATSHLTGGGFGTAPHGLLGRSGGTLGRVIGDNHGGLVRGGFRFGYFGYGWGWRDSFFCFPFYCFDPFLYPCYISPWYYYPCLPPYVAAANVEIVDSYPSTNWSGSDYDWQPGNQAAQNPVLDNSVTDIVEAFEHDDHKAMDRVAPHSGDVNIYTDGKYNYSLKANEFYDTYVDGIESTKTDRYEILNVKANADGTAKVVAKHVYNDPAGKRTSVYHTYFLKKEGDEYVIREFGTSDYKAG